MEQYMEIKNDNWGVRMPQVFFFKSLVSPLQVPTKVGASPIFRPFIGREKE